MASIIAALDLNLGGKRSLELPKASSQKGPCHRSSRSCTGCGFTLAPISEGDETLSSADSGVHLSTDEVTSCTLPNTSQELLFASLVDSGGPFAVAVASGLGPRDTYESSVCEERSSKENGNFLRSLRLPFNHQKF